MEANSGGLSRREFIQLSAAALAALAVPEIAEARASAITNAPAVDYAGTLVVRNCSLVDVIDGTIRGKCAITVQDGRIIAVGAEPGELRSPVTVIDAGGRHIIPGLMDAHCHLTIQSCAVVKATDLSIYLRQLKNNCVTMLEAGITTVRDCGAFPLLIRNHEKKIRSGSLLGPRIVHCNSITNVRGSHPEILPSDLSALGPLSVAVTGHTALNFRSTDEMRAGIRKNIEKGASFIKLTMDDRSLLCGRGAIPVYTDEQLKEIFDTAATYGKPVAAHLLLYYGFRRTLDYPLHSMEHLVTDRIIPDEDIVRMADKKISIVPTCVVGQLSAFTEMWDELPAEYRTDFIRNELAIKTEFLHHDAVNYYDPYLHKLNMESIQWLKKPGCEGMARERKFMTSPVRAFDYMKNGFENLKKMRQAGIRIGVGTDEGVTFHYPGTVWRELELLTRIGFSNIEALRCATISNAHILGVAADTGSLERGKWADLVVLEHNPLALMETCRKPLLVMKEGRVQFARAPLTEKPAEGMRLFAL